jgi:hypothetical protein
VIVSDVITRVRRTFGDEAAVQVTDADVIRWINDAQIEIVKNNDSALQKTSLLNLVADQSVYTMPTDMLILRSLRYKFSSDLSFSHLKFKNMQEFDTAIDGWDGTQFGSDRPIFFTMYEGKATLFPTPSEAMAFGLKVLYNMTPTDTVLNTDALGLPLIYHNTIVKYCMYQASLLDEDREPAVLYKTEFQQDMVTLQQNETQDPTEVYQTITVREYDM